MEIEGNQGVRITGAASGLGLALTKEFVAHGCRVLALDTHEWVSQQMSKKDWGTPWVLFI